MKASQIYLIFFAEVAFIAVATNGQGFCGTAYGKPFNKTVTPNEDDCPGKGVLFTCDYFLREEFETDPCRVRCFHNKFDLRNIWCDSHGFTDRCSFRPDKDSRKYKNKLLGALMGGWCVCCDTLRQNQNYDDEMSDE